MATKTKKPSKSVTYYADDIVKGGDATLALVLTERDAEEALQTIERDGECGEIIGVRWATVTDLASGKKFRVQRAG